MNDKPKMGYHVGQKLFDEYVCKIASALEVNEKWNTLIKEHCDDPNWAVWKMDIIAKISEGKEIPYYGIFNGEIINKQIYLHWGFTEKLYTGTCTYPDGTVIEVEYYGKSLR